VQLVFSPLDKYTTPIERAQSRDATRPITELAVVGAPGASTHEGRATGEAHIFERNSQGKWVATKVLFAPRPPDLTGSYPPVGCASDGSGGRPWCASSLDTSFTTKAGDRFGAAVAVLLRRNLHDDAVFVGAPMASGGRGAVYVFRRGQESYERLCGLGHDEADGSRGGRGAYERGERQGTSFSRTSGGTGAGGGWGLIDILFDSTPSLGALFGFSIAAAPSIFPASSSPTISTSAQVLLVGSPGYSRQGRAEYEAALPDVGCALVFRHVAEGSWALEERLMASGTCPLAAFGCQPVPRACTSRPDTPELLEPAHEYIVAGCSDKIVKVAERISLILKATIVTEHRARRQVRPRHLDLSSWRPPW